MYDPLSLVALFTVAGLSLLGVLWLMFGTAQGRVDERLNELRAEQEMLGSAPGGTMADLQEFRQSWSQKEERRKKLGERLIQAGLYKRNSVGFFYSTQALLGGLPIVIGLAAATMGFTSLPVALVCGAATGVAGIIAPGFWLDAQKRKRQTTMRRALPDALDLLVICVEAGLSLPAALVRITKELRTAYPMLALEMMIVHREIQLGHTTGEALKRFGDRFDLEEVRSLASVIRQAERFGASIVNALRVHAETLRHIRLEQARERAQKATVKLLFPTVLCIFPAMFVVILGPAVFQILELFQTMDLQSPGAGPLG
jgi:tight adherence protein C